MYILPREFVCPVCRHKSQYSPHEHHHSPVFDGKPTCPKCYEEFITKHVPTMNWSGK